MKKKEAQMLAPSKSNLIMEYITQILSDTDKLNGDIEFNFAYIIQKKFHKKSFYLYCRLIPYIQGLFW